MTSAADTPDSFNVLAEGIVYSIDVETVMDDRDWLDDVLLEVTRDEPRSLQELFEVLRPLPRRLVENALARLLERNVMLLDIYDGSVRASPLNEKPVTRIRETFHIWQDHASGMIVLRDQIRSVESRSSRSEEGERRPIRLGGGPPRRTPLEMTSTELLHQLRRVRNRIDPRAEVQEAKRIGRVALSIRTILRDDGRHAFLDAVPWRLRAAWARVSSLQSVADQIDGDLPVPWDVLVGRWAQDANDRISRQPRRKQTASSSVLLQILDANLSVEMMTGGTAITKEMARAATTSAVVAAFGGHGTPGEAAQILIEAPVDQRILVVGSAPPEAKVLEWKKQSIRVVPTLHQEGPDFVLIDGVKLALGGIRGGSSGVIRVSAQSPLEGIVTWLDTVGVTIPRYQPAAVSIATDVQNLERDLFDYFGESAAQREKGPETEDDSAMVRIRQYLKERCDSIAARLQRETSLSFTWLSAAEVLSLVEEWNGYLRVIARTESSALVSAAVRRKAECITWPANDVSADCVILDDVVLLGFAPIDIKASMPEFLAIADADFARTLKLATSLLPPKS